MKTQSSSVTLVQVIIYIMTKLKYSSHKLSPVESVDFKYPHVAEGKNETMRSEMIGLNIGVFSS